VCGVLASPVPAGAIINGIADEGAHPNVGTLIARDATGELFRMCSGTLVSETVVLTSGHCIFDPSFPDDVVVGVSFDEHIAKPPLSYLPGTPHAHPGFTWSNGGGYGATGPGTEEYDIGVVVLDEPVRTIAPARLPTLGQLDQMNQGKGLRGMPFVVVGYGSTDPEEPGAAHCCGPKGDRRYATSTFRALTREILRMNQNLATGNGGTCYGDSGGPSFIGTTDIIASITFTGDIPCVSNSTSYRVDTAVAREFLEDFVSLP